VTSPGSGGEVVRALVRAGSYHDSVVLMQLQRALDTLPGILASGVVMATPANREVLADSGLLVAHAAAARADDLVIAVRAESLEAAELALDQAATLLAARRPDSDAELRPRSLATALAAQPAAAWVLVSVPGRYAAAVAHEALAAQRHVFLYSDNVTVADEVALKAEAARRGLLVLGPDCGTAMVAGIGLGFGNRVRAGAVAIVAASGTGLQTVASRIHALGGGVRAALGTGGRDLSSAVGAATALRALALFANDAGTSTIVLISKPPAPAVATRVLAAARACGKPVVICLLGQAAPAARIDNLYFSRSLAEAAELAVELAATAGSAPAPASALLPAPRMTEPRYLRALFSGGTLAYEALLGLRLFLGPIWSNAPLDEAERLADAQRSREHTLLDLGADEFTVGKPHPMLDPALVAERLEREAREPGVAVVLLDVVLGDGAHADPAGVLHGAITTAAANGIVVVALLVGTDEDPQGRVAQAEKLEASGALVVQTVAAAIEIVLAVVQPPASLPAVASGASAALGAPLRAINVGVESFATSLAAQGAEVLHVDWRPPAGGNEKLQAILARMKG
jgi:FdrA protein